MTPKPEEIQTKREKYNFNILFQFLQPESDVLFKVLKTLRFLTSKETTSDPWPIQRIGWQQHPPLSGFTTVSWKIFWQTGWIPHVSTPSEQRLLIGVSHNSAYAAKIDDDLDISFQKIMQILPAAIKAKKVKMFKNFIPTKF